MLSRKLQCRVTHSSENADITVIVQHIKCHDRIKQRANSALTQIWPRLLWSTESILDCPIFPLIQAIWDMKYSLVSTQMLESKFSFFFKGGKNVPYVSFGLNVAVTWPVSNLRWFLWHPQLYKPLWRTGSCIYYVSHFIYYESCISNCTLRTVGADLFGLCFLIKAGHLGL